MEVWAPSNLIVLVRATTLRCGIVWGRFAELTGRKHADNQLQASDIDGIPTVVRRVYVAYALRSSHLGFFHFQYPIISLVKVMGLRVYERGGEYDVMASRQWRAASGPIT